MINLQIAGPLICVLSLIDVMVHIHLDIKKARQLTGAAFREPNQNIPSVSLWVVTITTLLSFLLVLLISIGWLFNAEVWLPVLLIPLLEPPTLTWVTGVAILIVGIGLHLWSRAVRGDMASSWAIPEKHHIVTRGPYSCVRHPSYLSYCLSFVGLFMMIPSVATAVLLLGIVGYYNIAVIEEQDLLEHYGVAYQAYMDRTGRFFPQIRRRGT